jgi:GTP-binding protein
MEQREEIRRLLALKLDFVPYVPQHFISARHGTGVGELVAATIKAYDAAMTEIPTPKLSKTLERAMVQHQPPMVRGRRIKLRYAHQGGRNPPRIIIHGNQTVHVPEAYTRYLANVFRREFDLFASPVAVEYRTDANPYARGKGRPERLTASEKRSAAKGKARGPRKRG